jgi:hypothetical protein
MEVKKRMTPILEIKLEEEELGYMLALIDVFFDHVSAENLEEKDAEWSRDVKEISEFAHRIRNELVR